MNSASAVPLVVVTSFAVLAGVTDIWKFRVPNLLTFPALVLGVAYQGAMGGLAGVEASLAGALFGFGVLFMFFLLGAMGAGDVKLMAAVGAWLGMPLTVYVFIVAGLSTGLFSVAVLAWNRGFSRALATIYVLWFQLRTITKHLGPDDRVETLAERHDRRQRLVPFAVMVAMAGFVLLLAKQWL